MHPIEHLRFVARARGVDTSTLVDEAVSAMVHLGRDRNDMLIAGRRLVERHPESSPLWWACSHLLASAEPRVAAREVVDRLRSDRTASMLESAVPAGASVVTVGWPEVAGEALAHRGATGGDVEVLAVDCGFEASGFVRFLERSDVRCEPVAMESIAGAVSAADVVLVEAVAVAPGRMLAEPGSHVVAAVAASVDTPVWLVAAEGRRLHRAYVDEIAARVAVRSPDGRTWPVPVDDLPARLVARVVTALGVDDDPERGVEPDCPLTPELLRGSPF